MKEMTEKKDPATSTEKVEEIKKEEKVSEKAEKKLAKKGTSEKPEKKEGKPSWIKIKPAELEKIIVGLANVGKSPAQIGLILRDKHGVPGARIFGKRITQILEEKGIEYKTEKKIIDGHIGILKKHIGKNKHDYPASRALTKKLWVVRKLS